jgi:hypothetical protein
LDFKHFGWGLQETSLARGLTTKGVMIKAPMRKRKTKLERADEIRPGNEAYLGTCVLVFL